MDQNVLFSHRFTNLLHTFLLLVGMIALLAVLGLSFAGLSGVLWAVVLGLLILLFGGRISPQMILRMYRARPLATLEAPGLYRILERLTQRAGLDRVPRLFYVPSQVMNAFAVGSRGQSAIGVTDGLLRRLTVRELTAILAHEISHLDNNDLRVMGLADAVSRMTSVFSMIGQIMLLINLPLLLIGMRTIPWLAVLLLIAAPTLSGLLQLALSRTREFDADLDAVRLTGDPEGLAAALQKLEYHQGNLFLRILMPGYRVPDPSLLRTHPDTQKRIERLLQLRGEVEPMADFEMGDRDFLPSDLSRVTRRPRWRVMGYWY